MSESCACNPFTDALCLWWRHICRQEVDRQMFQVFIATSGGGPNYDFGPQVDSLVQAAVVVRMGDWLFDQGAEQINAILHWEGCDVYVREVGTDHLWSSFDDITGLCWEVVR